MTDPSPVPRLLPGPRVAALLALVVVVAVVIRVDQLRNTAPPIPPPPAVSDAAAYRLLGANLVAGEGYVRPFDLEREGRRVATAEYPPGYPVLLAAADLAGVRSETGQRALLCVVGGITVALVGLVARRLGGDGAGLGAAAVAAVHPSLWSTDTSPLAEPLAAGLAMAVVLAALAVHDRPSALRWAALGVLAGVGGLVRSELLVMGAALVVPLVWTRVEGARPRLAALALGLGALALPLAPWTARNWAVFDRFVPVSNNLGSVLRGANCERAYHGEFRGLWVTTVGEDGDQVDPEGICFTGFDVADGRSEADSAAELRAEGIAYVRANLDEVPGVVAARLGRTVGLYRFDQQVDFARFEGRTPQWDRLGTRAFQLLSVVAVAGALAPWRGRGPRWVLAVPVAAVVVTVAATYGNFRFRAVADPAVVVLAVLAVADLARRRRSSAGEARPAAATGDRWA